MGELLELTTPGIVLENEIEHPLHFPHQSKKIASMTTLGSKAPAYDLNGLKFEPAKQDLEEFMASKEKLLK
jgi:hypothetical protein